MKGNTKKANEITIKRNKDAWLQTSSHFYESNNKNGTKEGGPLVDEG